MKIESQKQIDVKKKEVEITKDDLKTIYSDDYEFFQGKIVPNCHCNNCTEKRGKDGYTSTIVHYRIFMQESGDVILRGRCSVCGTAIARYVETGEVSEYVEGIAIVRKKYIV